jgi:hypothetical protein
MKRNALIPSSVRLDQRSLALGNALICFFALALLSGCLGKSSSSGSSSSPSNGADPTASGQITLEGCRGLSGVNEKCTLVTNASACTTTRCRRMVVIFSGGDMGCVTGSGYNNALLGFASQGYAAVCINYFDTSWGSGEVPYVDEATRIDYAVKEATSGAWATKYWTGEYLLLEGISHGATAPMILLARTSLAAQAHWRGSLGTGACFFDGSYDQAATASLLATGGVGGSACTSPVPYTRGLERYCGAGATGATCNLTTNTKAQEDTITSAPVQYSIRHFKMFECGSSLSACLGDIIPGAPVQQLCTHIAGTSGYTCSYSSLPFDGHLTCHANQYDQCRTWFESVAP